MKVGLVALPIGVLAAACGSREAPVQPAMAVPPGAVAVVSTDAIAAETVTRIASAQSVDARTALGRAVSDALLAADARGRLHPSRLRSAGRRALARAVLEAATAEATAAGPITAAELARETERRWWALDRPPLIRTTHAVVVSGKVKDEARLFLVARRLADAVAKATDAGSFRLAANTVSEPGIEIRVEDLEPVTEDGRVVDPAVPPPPGAKVGTYDSTFAAAVFKIGGVGKQSGIVKTPFGYHVILETAAIPAYHAPEAERRELLTPDVLIDRATKLRDAVIERARAVDHVEIERAAGELTEKVNVSL